MESYLKIKKLLQKYRIFCLFVIYLFNVLFIFLKDIHT
jgi:hypothetical protein